MFWKKKEPEDYIRKKQYQKAIDLYRERLKEQPRNTALLMNIADTLLLDHKIDQAVKEYKKVAEIQTEQGFILKAIALYKKVLKIQPSNSEIEMLLSNLSDRMALTGTPDVPAAGGESQETPAALQLGIETKLFRDLSPEEFKQIVTSLNLRHYHEDTIVVKEGDPGDSLFIVVRGQVRVLTQTPAKKEVVLANLGEGEFFGEVALLTGKPRTATIITNTTSELLELTREDYKKIIDRYPNVKKVAEEFHLQRTLKTVEAMVQAINEKA